MKAIFAVMVGLAALITLAGCTSIGAGSINCKATIEKVYNSLDTKKECLQTETGKELCAYDDLWNADAYNALSSLKTGQDYVLTLQNRENHLSNTTEVVVTHIYTTQTAQSTYELKDVTQSCG